MIVIGIFGLVLIIVQTVVPIMAINQCSKLFVTVVVTIAKYLFGLPVINRFIAATVLVKTKTVAIVVRGGIKIVSMIAVPKITTINPINWLNNSKC